MNRSPRLCVAPRSVSEGKRSSLPWILGYERLSAFAEVERDFVSDVIALGLPDQMPPEPPGVRLHIVENAWRTSVAAGQNVYLVRGTRALLSINPETLRI